MTQYESDAYYEGREAFSEGREDTPARENPYSPQTDEYEDWKLGWHTRWVEKLDDDETDHWRECLSEDQ